MTSALSTPPAVSNLFRRLERISPSLAAEVAYALWRSPGRRVRVHPSEQPTMYDAVTTFCTVRSRRVATYTWGTGDRVVLLVHGWQSRAAAFAPLVRELRESGRRIVAFDAPGNGLSSGRHTDVRDYAAIIAELEPAGGFEAIVAHSFGTPATALAIRGGVRTMSFITVNGAADFGYLLRAFGATIGAPASVLRGVQTRTERRLFAGEPDPFTRFSATSAPLSPGIRWLVLHDSDDAVVHPSQAAALVAANPASTELVLSHGLGHNRPLREPAVLDRIVEFIRR